MKLTFKEHKVVEFITFDVELPDLPDGWVYDYDQPMGYFMLKRLKDNKVPREWVAVYCDGGLNFSTRIQLDVLRVFCEAAALFSAAIAQHGKVVAT